MTTITSLGLPNRFLAVSESNKRFAMPSVSSYCCLETLKPWDALHIKFTMFRFKVPVVMPRAA